MSSILPVGLGALSPHAGRGGAPRSRPVSLAPQGGASAPLICGRETRLALGVLGQPSAPSGPDLHPAQPFDEGLWDETGSALLRGLRSRNHAAGQRHYLRSHLWGYFCSVLYLSSVFGEVLSTAGHLKLVGGMVLVKDLSSWMCPMGIMVSNLVRAELSARWRLGEDGPHRASCVQLASCPLIFRRASASGNRWLSLIIHLTAATETGEVVPRPAEQKEVGGTSNHTDRGGGGGALRPTLFNWDSCLPIWSLPPVPPFLSQSTPILFHTCTMLYKLFHMPFFISFT